MRSTASEKVQHVVQLRSKGLSVSEIAEKVGVSKSTAFRYSRQVILGSDQLDSLKRRRGGSTIRRCKREKESIEQGISTVGSLTWKEKLILASALYWAEGNKKDFVLSNSDPGLIQVFVVTLRDTLGVSDSSIVPSIRVYEDANVDKSVNFWSSVTGLEKERFSSITVLSGKKNGKLKYGMCRIRVKRGGSLLNRIRGVNVALVEALRGNLKPL